MPVDAVLRNLRRVLVIALPIGAVIVLATLLPSPFDVVALATIGVVLLAAAAWALDMIVPGLDLLSSAITRIRQPSGDYVVLTFDDGPIEPFTRRVLDVLDAHDVKATFFCIGENLRAHPELARAIADRGHDVANHSDSHVLLPLVRSATVRREIETAARTLGELTGTRSGWLRCPKGYKSRRVQRIARELGHELVGFSYPVYDVQNPPAEELVARVLDRAAPGDILLLHDGHNPRKPGRRDAVVEALPAILEGLRAKGLEPLSLSQALDREPALTELRAGAPQPAT